MLTQRYVSWGLSADLAQRILDTLIAHVDSPEAARRAVYHEVIDFWSDPHWQRAYDTHYRTVEYSLRYARIEPMLADVTDGATIVEVGCGSLALGKEIAQRKPQVSVIGTDISDYHTPSDDLPNLSFRQQTQPTRIPLADASADIVVLNVMLHHVDPEHLGGGVR